jgi:arylsulfatase A-like enzyme
MRLSATRDDPMSIPATARRTRIVLETKFLRPALLCAFLLVASGCGESPGSGVTTPSAAQRPNVLVISIDTLRADHLSCYGYPRATSPHIDRLAADGALFERAWSTTSWTLPAHLSMLTGEYISAHGVCDDRLWDVVGKPGGPEALPLCGTFVSELARQVGYRTAGFYSWKYLEPRFGFGPGFETWERIGYSVYSHPVHSVQFETLRAANDKAAVEAWRKREPLLFDDQRPTAGETVDAALGWLERRNNEPQPETHAPFFLFVHLFDVHDAYKPPPPFDTRFCDPAYSGPITGDQVSSPKSLVVPGMAPADLEHLIALYDGEIAWTDTQVQRLLDYLDAQGLRDDTLVVLTSDHGEEFFEHGQKTHRVQLHPESLRVPLVLRWPARIRPGTHVAGNASLVDIVPTLCELLDLPVPRDVSGRSLVDALRTGSIPADRDLLSELFHFAPGSAAPLRRLSLVRGDAQWLIDVAPGGARTLLRHDFASDPLGRSAAVPIALGSTEEVELGKRLDNLRVRVAELRCPPSQRRGEARPLSELEKRELSNLGYVQGGTTAVSAGGTERLCLDGCVWPDK